MLLAEYLNDSQYSYLRQDILCFSFGEVYEIKLKIGKSIGFTDLGDILEVMRAEFKAANAGAAISFSEVDWSRRAGAGRMIRKLVVTSHPLAVGDSCNIDTAVEQVRRAVTMYNLTQSWDQFNKGNL